MNLWKDSITLNGQFTFKFLDVDEASIMIARVSADKMHPVPVETFLLKPKQAEILYGWLSSFVQD